MSTTPPDLDPEPKDRSAAWIGVLIGVLALALVASVFVAFRVLDDPDSGGRDAGPTPSAEPSAEPSGPQPSVAPSLARFYDQKLRWKDCEGDECATLTVPLDYDEPEGATVDVAVLRLKASDSSDRIGSLVVNPGGPGGSGVDFARAGASQFGDVLTRYYDIVGFDPRGVGRSDPTRCATTAEMDALLSFDPDPDDAAEGAELDRLVATIGQGCLARSGELARHISTKEVARDLDILRAALGQRKLDYLGSSYGTLIGATYADMFPENVGRFVLDGAVDPALSNAELALGQARGFDTALRAYVQDCIDQGSCLLGDSVRAGTQRIRALLDQLGERPLPTSSGRKLTDGWATLGVFLPLYVKSYWPILTQALESAIEQNDGSALLAIADTYAGRGEKSYKDNSIEALYAVNCLDHSDTISTAEVPKYFPRFLKASATFGRTFAFALSTCSAWPVKSGEKTEALSATGAPPIVVIGTTRDPATPLVWAQAMAKQLDSGRLITRDGDGHTGFQRGNDCVDDAVERWLVSGKAPRSDLRC